MSTGLRLAGAGMALGGILFFTRMAPIFAVIPDDMAFPPATSEDLVRLAIISGARWPISHAMGLVAVALFTAGYWAHARAMAKAGRGAVAFAAAALASLAFGAFAVALVIDGFIVPTAALQSQSPVAAAAAAHADALKFFTPGVFTMFIAMGVLSSRLLHGMVHSRWLGVLGMAIAVAGPTAYLFGVAGPNWDNLQIGGSLMMAGFLWHFLIGAVALFGRGVRA